MKIVETIEQNEKVISLADAKRMVEDRLNNETEDHLYIVKYEGKIISFSGEYYKFAWKTMGMLKAALTNKFGRELTEALVENEIIEIFKIRV